MSEIFEEIRMLDNFYQTSSFYPMPVLLICTVNEDGTSNIGPYSLCFPYVVTGMKDYSMLLISRADSNTSQNIMRNKVCSLNFISDKKKYMKNCVQLGFPGESSKDKMKNNKFTLLPSTRTDQIPEGLPKFPDIVEEAFQVFECTWDDSHPIKPVPTSPAAHYVLLIEKLMLKKKWNKALRKGKGFPRMPIDYGFRDNVRFWFTKHSRPYSLPIPKSKETPIEAIVYATTRFDPDIKWEREACAKILKVPGIFLNKVISGCVEEAKKEGLTVITPEFMDKIRAKRSGKK